MKTKHSDIDDIKALSEEEINAFIQQYKETAGHPPGKEIKLTDADIFLIAISLDEPAVVKYYLEKKNQDGSFLLSNKEVDWGFCQLLMAAGGGWGFGYFPNRYNMWPDESEGGIRNRELCFRLILGEMFVDRSNGRRPLNNKEIAKEILNDPHLWRTEKIDSLLDMAGQSRSSANARLINVFVDECQRAQYDLSSCDFNPKTIPVYHRYEKVSAIQKSSWPKYNPMMKKEKINYEMLEEYLRLYLKMEYEDKPNPSLFEGIKSFFRYEEFDEINELLLPNSGTRNFLEKMKEFPKVLAKAYENAEKELKDKNPNFDPIKLRKITNNFEATITPEMYKEQETNRSNRFIFALGLTIATLGIAAPFVWPWYIYQRSKEPIKATDTTVEAYAKYLEKPDKQNPDRAPLEHVTNEALLQRQALKNPIKEVKNAEDQTVGQQTHKIVQPLEEGKIRVFSSKLFKQASEFQKNINKAEKEVKSKRPKM